IFRRIINYWVFNMIINGEGAILGRMAAVAAKSALKGEQVTVVNAEKIIISGNPRQIVERYKVRRSLKNKADPEKSPKWPRRPDMLVRRIIRGMLPYDKSTGRQAFKRIRVYMGVPEEFASKLKEAVEVKKNVPKNYISINQLSRELGWYGKA
ncbi:MAG: 50S ribosomal protein L13, partial [Candidatus Micrarchaeia archaeon]